jgi:DNA-directed RNA polymerase subunit E'
VRITAVSLGRGGSSGKIGVTARQPFLGKLDWIKEELKIAKGEVEEKEKGKKPEKAEKPERTARK